MTGAIKTCLLVLIAGTTTLAQNISTNNLTWEAVETTNLQTSVTTTLKCSFRTNSNTSVEWIQKKGQLSTLYTVTSVQGAWNNVAMPGSVTYTLQHDGKACKMTLEKTPSGTFITMDFSKPGEYTSLHRFKIVTVQ